MFVCGLNVRLFKAPGRRKERRASLGTSISRRKKKSDDRQHGYRCVRLLCSFPAVQLRLREVMMATRNAPRRTMTHFAELVLFANRFSPWPRGRCQLPPARRQRLSSSITTISAQGRPLEQAHNEFSVCCGLIRATVINTVLVGVAVGRRHRRGSGRRLGGGRRPRCPNLPSAPGGRRPKRDQGGARGMPLQHGRKVSTARQAEGRQGRGR